MEQSPAATEPARTAARSDFFVVSVGGSLLVSETGPDLERIRAIADTINRLASAGYKFALVVGGGKICRSYLAAAEQLNHNNSLLDELGIAVTRVNAMLFLQAIPNAFPKVITSLQELDEVLAQNQIPVLGGLLPGFTTDAVAVLVAERLNGTFVNLSNVDGVFSSDPATNKKARLYRELSFERLFDLAANAETKPGQHCVIDVPASLILKRSQIPAIFVNGNNMENFESAVKGQPFNGTVVQNSEPEFQAESAEVERD